MSVLHLITRPPHQSDGLFACLSRLGQGDALLLLADGVYTVQHADMLAKLLGQSGAVRATCHVLQDDLACRGLLEVALPDAIDRVNYPRFVILTQIHGHCLTWC